MNFLVGPMVIAFTLYSGYSWAIRNKPSTAVLVSWTRQYIFQYQVEKHLIGGTVEIFDEGQNLIRSEPISLSTNSINFYSLDPGKYSIKVAKGTEVFDFTYVKQG